MDSNLKEFRNSRKKLNKNERKLLITAICLASITVTGTVAAITRDVKINKKIYNNFANEESINRSLMLEKNITFLHGLTDEDLLKVYDYVGQEIYINKQRCKEVAINHKYFGKLYGIVNMEYGAEVLPCRNSILGPYYENGEAILAEINSPLCTSYDDNKEPISTSYENGIIDLNTLKYVVPEFYYKDKNYIYADEDNMKIEYVNYDNIVRDKISLLVKQYSKKQ